MIKSPHVLAEEQFTLSEEYSRYSGILADLIKEEAKFYNENRPEKKSDTAVKRLWETTEKGVKKTIVELKLNSLSKTISSIKTLLEVLANEARGLY